MTSPTATRPTTPTPLSPEYDAVVPLDAAVFQWEPAARSPSTYVFQIASEESFENVVFEVDSLPTTELVLSHALPAGRLWWHVRGDAGQWCTASPFVAGTPADVEIARRAEAARADRERIAAREAKRMERLARPLPEAPPAPVWPHASGPALDPAAPPVDWQTVLGFGVPDRSDEVTIGSSLPAPVGPIAGEIVDAQMTTFRWRGVAGATGYDLEVSPDLTFDRNVLAMPAGNATELSLQGVFPPQGIQLYWRVRARTDRGVTGWSPCGRFYPAGIDAAEHFQAGLASAIAARRRQLKHERLVTARELELVPTYQRPDAVTSLLDVGLALVMLGSGLVTALTVLVILLVM